MEGKRGQEGLGDFLMRKVYELKCIDIVIFILGVQEIFGWCLSFQLCFVVEVVMEVVLG